MPRGWGRVATKERGRDGASFSERGDYLAGLQTLDSAAADAC